MAAVPARSAPATPARLVGPGGLEYRQDTVSTRINAELTARALARCDAAGVERGSEEKKPRTLANLVENWRRFDVHPLKLGRMSAEWIAGQADRPAAIKQLERALVEARMANQAVRVNRYVQLHWIAQCFGRDLAETLTLSVLRELGRLVARDTATDRWSIRAAHREAAMALWARIVAERLTAEAVRVEVARIRPARSVKVHGRRGAIAKLFREVGRLGLREDLMQIIRIAQSRVESLTPETSSHSDVA